MRLAPSFLGVLVPALALGACAATERRFPLRAPLAHDTDLRSGDRPVPSRADAEGPEPRLVRPGGLRLAAHLGRRRQHGLPPARRRRSRSTATARRANVNSLDEVPDSAWFTNRIGVRPMAPEELRRGACDPSTAARPAGGRGRDLGHRQGQGRTARRPAFASTSPARGSTCSRASATASPSARARRASSARPRTTPSGFNTSCEQVVYFKPSLLKLTPGLRVAGQLRRRRSRSTRRRSTRSSADVRAARRARAHAGVGLAPGATSSARSGTTGTRERRPERRHPARGSPRAARRAAPRGVARPLRRARAEHAWTPGSPDRHGGERRRRRPATSSTTTSTRATASAPSGTGTQISRRLGYSYIVDWGDIGARLRHARHPDPPVGPRASGSAGHEMFGYFNVEGLRPRRVEERVPEPGVQPDDRARRRVDGAHPRALHARAGRDARRDGGSSPTRATPRTSTSVLEGRLEKILERYLTRLSPIARRARRGVRGAPGDLRRRPRRGASRARSILVPVRGVPGARRGFGDLAQSGAQPLAVARREGGGVCVTLPHVAADGGPPDDAAERYVGVAIDDGVARGPLVAHLYDLGPARGYRLVGLDRPER